MVVLSELGAARGRWHAVGHWAVGHKQLRAGLDVGGGPQLQHPVSKASPAPPLRVPATRLVSGEALGNVPLRVWRTYDTMTLGVHAWLSSDAMG